MLAKLQACRSIAKVETMLLACLCVLIISQSSIAAAPVPITNGVTLLPGGFESGRGPDGNTIILDAPNGLIVIDTGRHVWHSNAIVAHARAVDKPVAAIINTHWHLDHSSGNVRLKAAFPRARLYATNAIDRALRGFLARNAAEARPLLEAPDTSPTQKDEIALFLDTMENADALRPDVVVSRTGVRRIAGRRLDLRLTAHAVTDQDLWIYDRKTRIAILGDLVTFPVPFLDTACPQGWRAALEDVLRTPFQIVLPGHGPPMTRQEVIDYKNGLARLLDCAADDDEPAECAAGWTRDFSAHLAAANEQRRAAAMVNYYVTLLREHDGRSPDCAAPLSRAG